MNYLLDKKNWFPQLVWALLLSTFSACSASEGGNGDKQQAQASASNAGEYPMEVSLSGKILNPKSEGKVTIYRWKSSGKAEVASFEVAEDGSFETTLSIEEPGFYLFNAYDQQEGLFIITDKPLTIEADGSTEGQKFVVTGSQENELLQEFQTMNQALNEEGQQLQQAYYQAEDREAIAKQYEAFIDRAVSKLKGFIDEHDAPYASLLAANALDKEQHFEYLSELADKLANKYPNSQEVQEFQQQMKAMASTSVGSVAPEISLKNPAGEVVKLSSLRGKYVLIDFWASWCGPCRRENPNVVRMYDRFKDKDFEIYGVSLDRDREKWLQAIEKDGLKWVHVSDLKFWQSEAAQTYNVTGIPMTVLIDPEGKIIAKNLRGQQLEEKLEEVL